MLKCAIRAKYLAKELTDKKLTDIAYPVFVKNTPIDTGNARRHTTKIAGVITGAYPYAVRLDNGWSKQSPDGMVNPTIKYLRDYIKQLTGK